MFAASKTSTASKANLFPFFLPFRSTNQIVSSCKKSLTSDAFLGLYNNI